MAGAIYYMQINFLPNVAIPKTPAMPNPNGYDYFIAANKLDKNSEAWTEAASETPGVKSSFRTYSLAEEKTYLKALLPALNTLETGLRYPCAIPKSPADSPFAHLRNLARMLGFAGKVCAEEGDYEGAERYDIDSIQFGERIDRNGSMSFLVAGACQSLGTRRLWPLINRLSAGEARTAIARIEGIESQSPELDQAFAQSKWDDVSGLMAIFKHPSWRKKYLPTIYLASDQGIVANEMRYDDAWIAEVRKSYADRLPFPAVPADPWHEFENEEYVPGGKSGAAYGGSLNYFRAWAWYTAVFART